MDVEMGAKQLWLQIVSDAVADFEDFVPKLQQP